VRRRAFLLAAFLAMLTVLVPAGQAGHASSLTIRILSVTRTMTAKDVAPKGLSAGDQVRMTDRLFNAASQFGKPKGALVGSDWGVITIRKDKRSGDFRGVMKLPGGTITAAGRVPLDGTPSSAGVVSGTGRFANARGSLAISTLPGRGRAANVFHLTFP
jgi:hypothetical protein